MLNHEPYLDFVAQESKKIGKLFIIDTGEGRDFIDTKTGWYLEDLSGWLIDPSESEQFTIARKKGTTDDDFADSYVFAKWSKLDDGDIKITFKKY